MFIKVTGVWHRLQFNYKWAECRHPRPSRPISHCIGSFILGPLTEAICNKKRYLNEYSSFQRFIVMMKWNDEILFKINVRMSFLGFPRMQLHWGAVLSFKHLSPSKTISICKKRNYCLQLREVVKYNILYGIVSKRRRGLRGTALSVTF